MVGITEVNSTGFGLRPHAGYQFTQNWALEMGGTLYSDTDVTVSGVKGKMKQLAIDLSVLGIIPLGERSGLFARIGPAYVTSDRADLGAPDEKEFTIAYGLGINHLMGRKYQINASWSRVEGRGNISSADLFAAGIAYRFG